LTRSFLVARAVDAQSFGQPGQRTFRLRILGAALESAWLWLEKEHLRALSLACRQVLLQAGHGKEPPPADLGQFPEVADYDFPVGSIGMGFNAADRTVVLQFEELGKGEESALRTELTLDHCASLVEQLEAIIAAGRPACLLCGLPIDPSGHACVRANGHSPQPIPESGVEGEDS